MRSTRRLAPFAVAAVSAGLAVAMTLPARAQNGPVLLRDVPAAVDLLGSLTQPATPDEYIQADTQIEPSIAVNPNNVKNVVIGYQEGRVDGGGDATNGWATTLDGGRTWSFGEVPGLTSYPGQGGTFDRASDAVVAFGPDNDVYYSSLVFDSETGNANRSGMAINVSKDGGRTWSAPVLFDDDNLMGLNDKNWVVVDNSDAPGHHKGRVYVVWDRVLSAVVYDYCDANCDQLSGWAFGGLFQTDLIPAYTLEGIGSTPIVLNDGSLAVIFDSQEGGVPTGIAQDQSEVLSAATGTSLTCTVALAAGSTPFGSPLAFGPAVTIASNQSNGVRYQRAGSMPSATYDTTTGTLWIDWEDARFHTESHPVNDILASSSSDGGLTWSAPQKVNPSTPTDYVDRYNAMISASPDGVIHVAYMSRQEGDKLSDFDVAGHVYYQESHDGGATWSTPLRADLPYDNLYYGAFSRGGTFEGDYNEIASEGGYSYIVHAVSGPVYAGEPVALTQDPGDASSLMLADSGKPHQHQRMYVAVIGPPEAAQGTPTPSPTQTGGGGTPGGTPNTEAQGAPVVPVALGAVGLVALGAGLRARRRRGGGSKAA